MNGKIRNIINARQIKAARALLDWSQEQLAETCGLSIATIRKIESGHISPRHSTMGGIQRALEGAGLEFIEPNGVRQRPDQIEVFEGIDRFQEFYDFLYNHLKKHGGDVCVGIYDEGIPSRLREDVDTHRKRMKELVSRGDVSFRILTTKSEFLSHGYAQYRWQPQQQPSPTGFYAFGDCLALMSFIKEHSPYVVVLQSASLAEGYRQSFNFAWDKALNPPLKRKEEKETNTRKAFSRAR